MERIQIPKHRESRENVEPDLLPTEIDESELTASIERLLGRIAVLVD